MKLNIKKGATSNILQIFIADSSSTTGAGLTGLTNASSGLTAYYHRDSDTTTTAISLVTMTVGTFTSSGFKEIDATNMPGWYQFCPPDAALASGASNVAFHLKGATNMAPLPIEVQLVAVDLQDSVRMGLTALPNANAGANGGLPLGDGSGQVTVGTNNDKNNYNLSTLYSPSFTNNTAQAGSSTTITLQASSSSVTDFYVGQMIKVYGGTGNGQSRVITAYNGTTKVATVDRAWATNPDNTSTYAILCAVGPKLDSSLRTTDVNSGVVNTNNDKTGYTASTVSDKTGYGLTSAYDPAKTAAQAGDIMKVSSGTGANQINLSSGNVTVGTNNDKTGYALTAGEHTSIVADVNSALDAAGTELSAVPSTTGTLRQKINFLFEYFRNKKTQTSSTETLYKEDASTTLGTASLADDGTTATKGEMN